MDNESNKEVSLIDKAIKSAEELQKLTMEVLEERQYLVDSIPGISNLSFKSVYGTVNVMIHIISGIGSRFNPKLLFMVGGTDGHVYLIYNGKHVAKMEILVPQYAGNRQFTHNNAQIKLEDNWNHPAFTGLGGKS